MVLNLRSHFNVSEVEFFLIVLKSGGTEGRVFQGETHFWIFVCFVFFIWMWLENIKLDEVGPEIKYHKKCQSCISLFMTLGGSRSELKTLKNNLMLAVNVAANQVHIIYLLAGN